MKNVFLGLACGIALTFAVAAVAGEKALEGVPAAALQGITIMGCEQKEPSFNVSCRSNNKCTITVVQTRYSCKGMRK